MDLKRQPNESRSDWGWRLLMHDLRNNLEPEQVKTSTSKDGAVVNNIYNYGTAPQTRFRFASNFLIVVTVILIVSLGLVLWKMGTIQYFIDLIQSWVP